MSGEPDQEAEGRDQLGEGIEHLQAAARELLRAGRSLLDAAESLIEDPRALQGVVSTLGALAHPAARSLRTDGDEGDDSDSRVEHIPLS